MLSCCRLLQLIWAAHLRHSAIRRICTFFCLKDDIFGVFLSDASRYGSKYADAFYRLHDDKKRAYFLEKDEQKATVQNPKYLLLYAALFILCILSVFNVVDTISVFASVCVVVAIIQPSVFVKVDYGLLATFACFFIFVGNVKNIPEVTQFISSVISGHEFESSVLCSQIISNVPASVMLSAFTDDYKSLILGTDIGGLGTLIASLASLISYKSYLRSEKSDSKKFINCFTIVNIIFLAVLVPMAKFVILK